MIKSASFGTIRSAVASVMAVVATPSLANSHSGLYNKQTVTKKASFHTLRHHAKSVQKSGLAKVPKIKRHGHVIGFKKTLKSGDKIIVRRGKHGRVHHTTLKRKSFLQRLKHHTSSASKSFKAKTKRLRLSVFGRKTPRHH